MSLQELVARYGETKAKMDSYKKQVDSDNKSIKTLMEELKQYECAAGGFVAKLSIIESESFNDEKLLGVLKELGLVECVKSKEYVDMDVLENLIYTNKLDPTKLAECKQSSSSSRLTISKEKK